MKIYVQSPRLKYMRTIECLKSTDAFQQYRVILPANNAIWGQSLPRMEQYLF